MNKLELKSIYELLGIDFYIPDYQRGYRWKPLQVRQLLDDLLEFTNKPKENNEFYCLQPVVVKHFDDKRGKGYEVIDGQQRLTTLRIILSFLSKEHIRRPIEEAYKKKLYSIRYQTRTKSEAFLNDIKSNTENIDFFHIYEAYKAVEVWFSEKIYDDHDDILKTLLGNKPDKPSVKVIWYEISENDSTNVYDVFTRLNIGKIPLTNAELIKALFLKKWNTEIEDESFRLMQLKIASEWDTIENTLQNDELWHFLYDGEKQYDTRIEYILDLMKGKKEGSGETHTFIQFNTDFEDDKKENGSPNIERLWQEVKKYFLNFQEWFNDWELYHLIGFLLAKGDYISELLKGFKNSNTKTEFKQGLKDKIKAFYKDASAKSLEYGDKNIKPILLLFNVQTILDSNQEYVRFPFTSTKRKNGTSNIFVLKRAKISIVIKIDENG